MHRRIPIPPETVKLKDIKTFYDALINRYTIKNAFPIGPVSKQEMHDLVYTRFAYYNIAYEDNEEWASEFVAMMIVQGNKFADEMKAIDVTDGYKQIYNGSYNDHGDPTFHRDTDGKLFDAPQNGVDPSKKYWSNHDTGFVDDKTHVDYFGDKHWDKTPSLTELIKRAEMILKYDPWEKFLRPFHKLFILVW